MIPDIPQFSMNQLRQAAISFPLLGEDFSICPPASFTLFGREIYFYGVIIAIGFALAVFYAMHRSEPVFGIKSDDVIDMLLAAVPLAIVCARLYYCLTYKDSDGSNPYLQDPKSLIYIWNGGLAIYGGVIGAVLGVILVCRHKKISTGAMLDVGGLGLLIGQSIGRWGNFMNREAYGWTENVDSLFCRMGLTVPGYDTFYVHPTFLYESLWNALGILWLHIWTKRSRRKFDGQVFILYIGWYGLGRMFIEGLRTDSLWLIPGVIRISQLLAGITFVAAIALLLILGRRKDNVLWIDRVNAPAEPADLPEEDPEAQSESDSESVDAEDSAEEPSELTEE